MIEIVHIMIEFLTNWRRFATRWRPYR